MTKLHSAWLVALLCLGSCTHNTPGVTNISSARDNGPAQNREIARHLIRREYSQWDDDTQFRCLDNLWQAESRWNHNARNKRTGACGIPQSFPCHKMASFGKRYGVDYRRNPWPQVAWGLQYIDQRYGSPCAAWKRFKRRGGY
jgi:hypothetical protein